MGNLETMVIRFGIMMIMIFHDDEDEHNIIVNNNLDWKGYIFPHKARNPN